MIDAVYNFKNVEITYLKPRFLRISKSKAENEQEAPQKIIFSKILPLTRKTGLKILRCYTESYSLKFPFD